MPDVGEVHADLMRPSGLQADLQQRVASRQAEAAKFGDGFPAVGDDSHSLAVLRIATDRRLDAGGRFGDLTDGDRPVAAAHDAILQLPG